MVTKEIHNLHFAAGITKADCPDLEANPSSLKALVTIFCTDWAKKFTCILFRLLHGSV